MNAERQSTPACSDRYCQDLEIIADDSETAADAFIERFDSQFQLLAGQPGLGRARDELLSGLRSFPFEKYVIFYLAIRDGIEVVRVLHGARHRCAVRHKHLSCLVQRHACTRSVLA